MALYEADLSVALTLYVCPVSALNSTTKSYTKPKLDVNATDITRNWRVSFKVKKIQANKSDKKCPITK